MKCDCKDCAFRGMEKCEHRKLMDEVNRLKATIQEAKDRMRYYFGTFDGKKTITIDRIHATEGAKEGDLQAIVKLIKEKVGEGDIEVVFEV